MSVKYVLFQIGFIVCLNTQITLIRDWQNLFVSFINNNNTVLTYFIRRCIKYFQLVRIVDCCLNIFEGQNLPLEAVQLLFTSK
jgi:hypothetical protein